MNVPPLNSNFYINMPYIKILKTKYSVNLGGKNKYKNNSREDNIKK